MQEAVKCPLCGSTVHYVGLVHTYCAGHGCQNYRASEKPPEIRAYEGSLAWAQNLARGNSALEFQILMCPAPTEWWLSADLDLRSGESYTWRVKPAQ